MSDYTVKRIDEMEGYYLGAMKRARAELGVTSFGLQVMDLPPNLEAYPEHDHAESRVTGSQLGGGSDALVGAGGGHPDVGEHDVGLEVVDRSEQRVVVVAHAGHLDVVDRVEEARDRRAHEVVVLGDHHSDGHAA